MEDEEIWSIRSNYNRWPIILETDLDSIELSRLFAKLKIEAPDNFAMLLPPTHAQNGPTNCQPFHLRIIDLKNSNNENYGEIEMYQGDESWECNNSHTFNHHNKKTTPFKIPDVDFLFPFEIPIFSSPLNELSPFPSSLLSNGPTQGVLFSKPKTIISYYYQREFEYKDKLAKLGRVCPETHPAMVKIMKNLGALYYDMRKFSLSEHWYRRVITTQQQLDGTNSVQILQTSLDLIDAIVDQGRYEEAKKLHQEIYPVILDRVNSNHELVQQSLNILSRISFGLDQEDETYSRQLLQLRLNAFGLSDLRTLSSMQLLANHLSTKAISPECEDLLRIELQLHDRVTGNSDYVKCLAIVSLAAVLLRQRRYKESRPLFQRAVELAENSLGGEHPVSLHCNCMLARNFRMEGLLTESKELLETNLEKQIRLLGKMSLDAMDSMDELGEIFMETGQYEEATIWLEKAFRSNIQVFGVDHNHSITSCDALGRCYEKQERYADAIALYEQTMQEITARKGTIHLTLVKLQKWIDWNRDYLALQGGEKEGAI